MGVGMAMHDGKIYIYIYGGRGREREFLCQVCDHGRPEAYTCSNFVRVTP